MKLQTNKHTNENDYGLEPVLLQEILNWNTESKECKHWNVQKNFWLKLRVIFIVWYNSVIVYLKGVLCVKIGLEVQKPFVMKLINRMIL